MKLTDTLAGFAALMTCLICSCTTIYPGESDLPGTYVNARTDDTLMVGSTTPQPSGENVQGSYSLRGPNGLSLSNSTFYATHIPRNMWKPSISATETSHVGDQDSFWEIIVPKFAVLALSYEGSSSHLILTPHFPF